MIKNLGHNLKTLRIQKEWTLADAAARIDLSPPAMCKIENGKSDITLSRLNQLAALYGVSPCSVLNGSEEELPAVLQLNLLKQRLSDREEEIDQLQKKLITLYEESKKAWASPGL